LAYGNSARDAAAKAQVMALRVIAERLEHNEEALHSISIELPAQVT
jgi:hypothetical protein